MSYPTYSLKTVILAAIVLLLIVLSSSGTLDYCAQKHVEETRSQSIRILILSKGINATISVLQSTDIGISFIASGSIQAGEFLDPINDASERLSTVIVWAIGALFLQEFVLKVASSSVFIKIFFIVGLVAILALLLVDRERFRNWFCEKFKISETTLVNYRDLIVRIFITTSIFRFIVPAFVIISFLFSQMFLDTEIKEHKKNLSGFEQVLGDTKERVLGDASLGSLNAQRLEEQKTHKKSELDNLKESLSSYKQESENLYEKIQQLSEKVGWRGWIPEFLGGTPPRKELVIVRAKREKISQEIQEVQEKIRAIENDLECINLRLAGKNCASWLDKLYNPIKEISKIFYKTDEAVTSITNLLAAIVVKNILLPLIFLMFALKCSLPIARYSMRLVSGLRRDAKELQGYIERGD